MDERIDKAKRVLLANLRPIDEGTLRASVYVLTPSDAHEWVPIEGQLTIADAADLVRDLSARDRATQFHVSRGDVRDNAARDRLLAGLRAALAERHLSVKDLFDSPTEPGSAR